MSQKQLTSNGTRTATAPIVVDHERIAFHNAIHSEVASVSSVSDLTIFETLDGYLDRVYCRSSCFEYVHGKFGCTAIR